MNKEKLNDKQCGSNRFKKVRYFHGMLMTDRDFREEQIYHNEKRKLLNRMLHGWGVVCGLGIKATCPESSKVIITPGFALDCCGNEIVVCEDFEVDLKQPVICEEEQDPCADKNDQEECKYYIAIKYHEAPTDRVPVYAPGDACEEKACDYSRTQEGFCVTLCETLPRCTPSPEGVLEEDVIKDICKCISGGQIKDAISVIKTELSKDPFCKEPYPCSSLCCCEGESTIVLGSINFKSTCCKIETISQKMIDINDGRRYVMTPMFWQHFLGSLYPPIARFLENPCTQNEEEKEGAKSAPPHEVSSKQLKKTEKLKKQT